MDGKFCSIWTNGPNKIQNILIKEVLLFPIEIEISFDSPDPTKSYLSDYYIIETKILSQSHKFIRKLFIELQKILGILTIYLLSFYRNKKRKSLICRVIYQPCEHHATLPWTITGSTIAKMLVIHWNFSDDSKSRSICPMFRS